MNSAIDDLNNIERDKTDYEDGEYSSHDDQYDESTVQNSVQQQLPHWTPDGH